MAYDTETEEDRELEAAGVSRTDRDRTRRQKEAEAREAEILERARERLGAKRKEAENEERENQIQKRMERLEREDEPYTSKLGRVAGKARGFFGKSDEQPKKSSATAYGGSPINPNIVVNTGKETAGWGPIIIIIFAYMIWGFDLTPYFGGRYIGFNFSTLLITQTNWYAVVTSGAIVAFLAWSIMTNMFEPHRQFVFFGAFMALALLYSRIYYRLEFANVTIPYFSIIVLAVLAVIGLVVLHRNGYDYVASETFCYAVMALTFSFFFINWSWTKDVKAVLHVIFIIGFYFYLYFQPQINKSQLYIFTSLFLVGDFFLYSLNFGNVVLSYFPILVLISSYYLAQFTGSKFARGNLFLLVIAMVFFIIFSPTIAESSEEGTSFERAEATQGAKGFLGGILESISNFGVGVARAAGKSIDYATGGLISDQYMGFVEKNQFEPLGVVFDRVKPAQPRFYTDEPVTIWGTIKSRTLSDPVNVQFTCFRFKDNKPIEADKTGTAETKDIVIPDKQFTVYTLEEKDVECTFSKNKLQAGANTLILSATYNFPTISYQKVYFIDAERHRAMIRENLDPLKEFGIADRTPKSISTNGPVEIGVGIQSLISVSDKGTSPALFITLTNRGKITDSKGNPVGKWNGKIKEIKELNVVVPKGITINPENLETCRPVRFKPFSKEDCSKSCEDKVRQPCLDICDKSDQQCIFNCDTSVKKCNDDCDNLFKSEIGAEEYTGYQLAVEDIKRRGDKEQFRDIESGRFLTFSCRLNLNKNDVLENAPITTKFIRIRARYDYLVESQVPVTVEQAPTLEEKRTPDYDAQISDQKYADIFFSKANQNEIKYSPIVFGIAKKYLVDYLFVKAIIHTENAAWNPTTFGDAKKGGSYGLMQVLTPTAQGLGCTDWNKDVESNVDCGVKYIKYLIDIQKNKNLPADLSVIAAGYNCGEKAMNSDTVHGFYYLNPDNCWSTDRKTNTREYVKKVIAAYNTLRNQLKIEYIPSEQLQTPTLANPEATYDSSNHIVLIKWSKSENQKATKYLITRYREGNSEDSFYTEQNSYKDSGIKSGLTYSYLIYAVDNNDNIYGSVETPNITIP